MFKKLWERIKKALKDFFMLSVQNPVEDPIAIVYTRNIESIPEQPVEDVKVEPKKKKVPTTPRKKKPAPVTVADLQDTSSITDDLIAVKPVKKATKAKKSKAKAKK